jgi:tocopherol cyclase
MLKIHGLNQQKAYFKGWYFKHQNDTETIAFIPGVQIDRKGHRSAFIQVITETESYFEAYDYNEYEVSKDELWIRIGKSEFSDRGVKIDVEAEEFTCKGDLAYGALSPLGHDVMGPFRFAPFMECRHAVLSMNHGAVGEVWLLNKGTGNKKMTFGKGSSGYIEMDWGRSFPESYAWVQCNRFEKAECSIMASVATIPFLGKSFLGCTCAIQYQGESYPLATFLGAKVISNSERHIEITQGKKRLQIDIIKENMQPLKAPEKGDMNRIIHESTNCKARFLFSNQGKIYFDLKSDQASFEYLPFS